MSVPRSAFAWVAGAIAVAALVRAAGLPRAWAEAALIAAVLAPLAGSSAARRAAAALDRPRRVALGAMLTLALAGQLVLGTRAFPFVNWGMYASLPHGDPVVYRYDALLRGGGRVALVPGHFLAPESADRLMEALRRQVELVRRTGDPAARAEHERALAAVAGLYDARHAQDPVAAVVVTARTVAIASGRQGAPRELWRVPVR